jgi:hypothetical protein
MPMKLSILLLAFFTLTASAKSFTHKEFAQLDSAGRVEIIKAYAEYLRGVETELSSEITQRLQWSMISEAYAQEYNCFYAGWPSSKVNGKCTNPSRTNPSYKKVAASCKSSELVCPSSMFGSGLCADISTQALRNSSFAQCEKKFVDSGAKIEDVAAQLLTVPSEADEIFQLVDQLCKVPKPNASMCNKLSARVELVRAARPVAYVSAGQAAPEPEKAKNDLSSILADIVPETEDAPPVEVPKVIAPDVIRQPVETLSQPKVGVSVTQCENPIPFEGISSNIEARCTAKTPKGGFDTVTVRDCAKNLDGQKPAFSGFSILQGPTHPLFKDLVSPYPQAVGKPYRTIDIKSENYSLNDTYINLAEMASGPDSHDVKSVMILLPRLTVPSISIIGDEMHVTLPTGETVIMDKNTKEIVSGALKEGSMDLNTDRFTRKKPNVHYSGNGISVRLDHRYEDPMSGAATAQISQGSTTCNVPRAALFADGKIKSKSDAEFLSAINKSCPGKAFRL